MKKFINILTILLLIGFIGFLFYILITGTMSANNFQETIQNANY